MRAKPRCLALTARGFSPEPCTHCSYEFSEWALRRRALALTNLRRKSTHSGQTVDSHFRREAETQVRVMGLSLDLVLHLKPGPNDGTAQSNSMSTPVPCRFGYPSHPPRKLLWARAPPCRRSCGTSPDCGGLRHPRCMSSSCRWILASPVCRDLLRKRGQLPTEPLIKVYGDAAGRFCLLLLWLVRIKHYLATRRTKSTDYGCREVFVGIIRKSSSCPPCHRAANHARTVCGARSYNTVDPTADFDAFSAVRRASANDLNCSPAGEKKMASTVPPPRLARNSTCT